VPSALRDHCGGAAVVTVAGATVGDVLAALRIAYPEFHRGVCDETGTVRRHVNVFVNESHMRDREGPATALAPGDEVTILPAVSGG